MTIPDQTGQIPRSLIILWGTAAVRGEFQNRSAICNLPGTGAPNYVGEVQAVASPGSLSCGQPAPGIYAAAAAGCCASEGIASAMITGAALISGCHGTGYLNVDFGYTQYGDPRQSGGSSSISAGPGYRGGSTGLRFEDRSSRNSGVLPHSNSGSRSRFVTAYLRRVVLPIRGRPTSICGCRGARVYTSQPSQCGFGTASGTNLDWGLCSDPNFT